MTMEPPLAGVLVLDFGRVIAAPRCTRLLADLGADVIHIERPEHGDDTRLEPYIFSDGLSGPFIQQNWGKKSLCIDLKHARAREVIYPLVNRADVVVENFRPGVMDRLGFGYEQLSALNPGVVMCSISSYGQHGPYADRIGYGYIVDALAGMAETNESGEPLPPQIALADGAASLLSVGLICAALQSRHRTGKGRYIDLALLEAIFCLHERPMQLLLSSKGAIQHKRRGLYDPTLVPWGYFEAANGWVCIICSTDQQWSALAKAIGRPELAKDPRFSTTQQRAENQEIVYDLLKSWVRSFESKEAVEQWLCKHRVPCAKVNSIKEAVKDEQVVARNLLVTREHPQIGEVEVQNFLGSSIAGAGPGSPAPLLGQHTKEIVQKLAGIAADDYQDLLAAGCIFEQKRAAMRSSP